jgi:hypothetical protein
VARASFAADEVPVQALLGWEAITSVIGPGKRASRRGYFSIGLSCQCVYQMFKTGSGLLIGGEEMARKAGEAERLCSYRVHEIAPKRTRIHEIASGPRVAAALCVVGGRFAARGPVSALPG